ncbi:hypothetical protein AVEN_157129-1 [Araneus ventricosus]|uniref:Uncharacterized protein n=1 Tax=Araneus ventricosus TaxID=182803 RepID=A0A4Y2BH04_ARAVE|nr:hypothetical protein AVEN_157129-1 [Araneus ventricosus]
MTMRFCIKEITVCTGVSSRGMIRNRMTMRLCIKEITVCTGVSNRGIIGNLMTMRLCIKEITVCTGASSRGIIGPIVIGIRLIQVGTFNSCMDLHRSCMIRRYFIDMPHPGPFKKSHGLRSDQDDS